MCNASELPATIRFKLGSSAAFSFPNRNEDIVLAPRASEQFNVYFSPKDVGKLESDRAWLLQLFVCMMKCMKGI